MSIADVLMQLQRLQWEIYEAIKPGVVTAEAMREATASLSKAIETVETLIRQIQQLHQLQLQSRTQRLAYGYQTTRHPIWGVDPKGVLRRILTTEDGKLVCKVG